MAESNNQQFHEGESFFIIFFGISRSMVERKNKKIVKILKQYEKSPSS